MRTLVATLVAALQTGAIAQVADTAIWIEGSFDTFTTDDLGNVYTVQGDLVELWGPDGRLRARNSAKTFGRITAIDAFSSLKPLVFSSEQRQFAMLDNTLSLQGSAIGLSRNGWPWVSLVCAGVQSCTWFFDERELSLSRVDQQLQVLATTGRLDQLLGHSPKPTQMVESGSLLYLCDPGHGVHVFDLFGTLLRTLPVAEVTQVQVLGGDVYYLHDSAVWVYDALALEPRVFAPLPEPGAVQMRMQKGHLYLRTEKGIAVHATGHAKP